MRKISQHVLDSLAQEPDICLRKDEGNCVGKITYEHALIYAGKQVDEPFAILKICEYHHAVNRFQDGGDLNKEKHEWLALSRATEADFQKYYKANWKQKLSFLNGKYGNK
jgi:hypothetical protein